MGLIDNFGRVASMYMEEKENLQKAEEKRKRTRTGHGFWPHEVLRDSIIFASMLSILLFYAWLIPPPLHGAADPYAQAGFVFPDWYVLFSYGYLRWGEYLPQFVVPTGFVGDIVGQPMFPWNAAWWGAALTGIPVGILALPPFLGGREKRPVEDPWFAAAGAVYLAHIWFISVFPSTSSWNCTGRIVLTSVSWTRTATCCAGRESRGLRKCSIRYRGS
ncbi:MAG: hypothetical protein CM15mP78_07560 [Candidatus Poseidoniales archaeon]|nr:MAG: hypothetical protein CM15mP78_07560 [Candidatus Poseidoniales archaeon]